MVCGLVCGLTQDGVTMSGATALPFSMLSIASVTWPEMFAPAAGVGVRWSRKLR